MITPLISPTEPGELQAAIRAISSPLPESKGSDILLHFYLLDKSAVAGIQRKVVPGDFIASIEDGRLSKELMQMREAELAVKILLLEGDFRYGREGKLMRGGYPSHYTGEKVDNILLSMQIQHGLILQQTSDIWHTVQRVLQVQKWLDNSSHDSFYSRHMPYRTRDWYAEPLEEERIIWWLQGIPEIGPNLARAMVKVFPKPIDLLGADQKDLVKVPGIGKPRATKILRFLRREL